MSSRIQESHLTTVDASDAKVEFLQTIRVPENFKQLKDSLPKPNYEPLKLKMEVKDSFLHQLDANPLDKKNGKSLGAIAPLKQSGLRRRRTPPNNVAPLYPIEKTPSNSLMIDVHRSVEIVPRGSVPTQKQSLPELQMKRLQAFDLKLKYLNKKKFENMYNKESVLIEEMKKRNITPEVYSKKYESVMTNIKL